MVIKILFLSANPTNMDQLELVEEYEDILNLLDPLKQKKRFDLNYNHTVSIDEIQKSLLEHNPDILHFSGHGSESGSIVLKNSLTGEGEDIEDTDLSSLLEILSRDKKIKIVFLNACYSKMQAKALSKYVDCVIGMTSEIDDRIARKFAFYFYQSIGYGKSVKSSFDLAIHQLSMKRYPEKTIPKLITRKEINSTEIYIEDDLWSHYLKFLKGEISPREIWEEKEKGNLLSIISSIKGMDDNDASLVDKIISTIPSLIEEYKYNGKLNRSQRKRFIKDTKFAIDLIKKYLK